MATFYKGDEVKFAIDLQVPDFDMDNELDNFDIEVASQKVSVKASKGASTDQLRIFSETVTPQEGDPYKVWYAIVDTTELSVGDLRVIATAHVRDTNANDGIRRQSAVATLGTLKNA